LLGFKFFAQFNNIIFNSIFYSCFWSFDVTSCIQQSFLPGS